MQMMFLFYFLGFRFFCLYIMFKILDFNFSSFIMGNPLYRVDLQISPFEICNFSFYFLNKVLYCIVLNSFLSQKKQSLDPIYLYVKMFFFLLQGKGEQGRDLIQKGINLRKELGVPLYVAAGCCDLGSEYLIHSLSL